MKQKLYFIDTWSLNKQWRPPRRRYRYRNRRYNRTNVLTGCGNSMETFLTNDIWQKREFRDKLETTGRNYHLLSLPDLRNWCWIIVTVLYCVPSICENLFNVWPLYIASTLSQTRAVQGTYIPIARRFGILKWNIWSE